MPAPTPIIILIKAGAASCEALLEVRLLIFSIIWGAGVLMITPMGGGGLRQLAEDVQYSSVCGPP